MINPTITVQIQSFKGHHIFAEISTEDGTPQLYHTDRSLPSYQSANTLSELHQHILDYINDQRTVIIQSSDGTFINKEHTAENVPFPPYTLYIDNPHNRQLTDKINILCGLINDGQAEINQLLSQLQILNQEPSI